MKYFKKINCVFALLFLSALADAQTGAKDEAGFVLTILNEKSLPVEGATVELVKDNKLVKAAITDAKGQVKFNKITDGSYTFSVTSKGYQSKKTEVYHLPS